MAAHDTGDPKVGDEMEYRGGLPKWVPVTVMTGPFRYQGDDCGVVVRHEDGHCYITHAYLLRPKPALKTFRLPWLYKPNGSVEVQAESKDAALKILAESLEEVTP